MHAHFAQSGGDEGRGEVVFLAHDLAHIFLSAQGDNAGTRLGGRTLQVGQRDLRGFHRSGRTGQPLPVEMVNKIAPTGRAAFFAEGERHRAEAFDVDRRTSGFVIERNIPLDQLVIVLRDFGTNARLGSRGAKKQDAREAHRQFHFFLQALHGASARREHVERGVHDDRMHRVVAGALGRGFGEGDEAGRASIAGGQFAQAAEFRTVGQPQPRHCFVRALRRLNLHFAGRRTPRRILEFRLDALGTERTDDVHRPIR